MGAETSTRRVRSDIRVEGMSCAACASRVTSVLESSEAVLDARVNFAAGRATVFHDGTINDDGLRALVRSSGYDAPAGWVESEITALGDGAVGAAADDAVEVDDYETRRVTGLWRRMIVAATVTVVVVAFSMVPGLRSPAGEWGLGAIVSLVGAAVVVFGAGWQFHRAGIRSARHLAPTMDTLVSLGSAAAWLWSVAVLVAGVDGGHVYFETGAVIVALVLVGKWLEARATRRSGEAVRALAKLGASTVRLVDGTVIDPIDLQVGMRFVVAPGERIATDGVVISGASAVDVSMVTGEPVPADITTGHEVIGATVNLSGTLEVEATRVGADTALAQIIRLTDEAQGGRAEVQRLVDRVAAVFVPIVLALAVVTLGVWFVVGGAASQAFTAAVAVLIISCPCALGLATPLAVMVGTGRGAQLGVIIKGGEVLEDTRRLNTVMLDKTGTVTEGRLVVMAVTAPAPTAPTASPAAATLPADRPDRLDHAGHADRPDHAGRDDRSDHAEELAELAAALESRSEHPVGAAIARHWRGNAAPAEVADFVNHPGLGVTGSIHGIEVRAGRAALFDHVPETLQAEATTAADKGHTTVLVGRGATAEAVISLADKVKPSSAEAVRQLRRLGLEVVLLTGDNRRTAEAVAAQIGAQRVVAEVLPADKAAEVAAGQQQGQRVAMVGDGINDAVALATADIGIAMGTGADVAMEASDLTIVGGDPRAVGDAITLARRTLRTIKVNLFWAFAYNVAAIPLAATGVLSPMPAAAAMGLSSLFVVSNSLRLRRFQPQRLL